MNKYAVLLIAGLFVSCKKETSSALTFVGQWKLLESVGGIAGKRITPPKDSVYILSLKADKSYQTMLNDQATRSGSYEISTKTSTGFPSGHAITFDSSGIWQFINVKSDTLFLTDPYPDGYDSAYIKVK